MVPRTQKRILVRRTFESEKRKETLSDEGKAPQWTENFSISFRARAQQSCISEVRNVLDCANVRTASCS